MRQNDFTLKCNLPRLPGESDCGSLYLETSHNHNYHKITSQNVHEIEKINEKRKHRAESRTKNTNSQKKKLVDLRYNRNRGSDPFADC